MQPSEGLIRNQRCTNLVKLAEMPQDQHKRPVRDNRREVNEIIRKVEIKAREMLKTQRYETYKGGQ